MAQRKCATEVSKLFAAVANCSEQVFNQNTNAAAEVCKVARKRTTGFTVKRAVLNYDAQARSKAKMTGGRANWPSQSPPTPRQNTDIKK